MDACNTSTKYPFGPRTLPELAKETIERHLALKAWWHDASPDEVDALIVGAIAQGVTQYHEIVGLIDAVAGIETARGARVLMSFAGPEQMWRRHSDGHLSLTRRGVKSLSSIHPAPRVLG